MTEKYQSPQSLVAQLTTFSLEQDNDFRRGISDAMSVSRTSRRCVGIVGEGTTNQTRIYDENSLLFSAEREGYQRQSKLLLPSRFTARLDSVTQIETLPLSLVRYFDEEIIESYEGVEPGDLNVLQSVEYVVEVISEEDVEISRNREYQLRDDLSILSTASETDETDKFEHIPIAHEQRTLRVAQAITEERIHDVADQVQYNAVFDSMFFDENAHTTFYPDFLASRNTEATIAILAIIKSLKTGSKIPRSDL